MADFLHDPPGSLCFASNNLAERKHVGVILKKGRNGKPRPTWYAMYELSGRRHTVNLGTPVAGHPPKSLRDLGDIAFERSRAKAQEKLTAIVAEAKTAKNSERILEKIYEHKTGIVPKSVQLENLGERWKNMPRSRKLTLGQANLYQQRLNRFVAFVQAAEPKTTDLAAVRQCVIESFLQKEEERGIAAKTYNDMVKLLKAVWHKLLPGFPNPILHFPLKASDTKFRRPYSEGQLQRIIEAAKGDAFTYPIIVTGVCTAMRQGDCCQLKWCDVDLPSGFISVETSKTGAQVEIPIWPLLREVLVGQSAEKKDEYVFPAQAVMYQKNPTGITWRAKKILRQAGIFDEDDESESPENQRLRRSKGYDFHSFRVTWVTMALSQGVPMELVRRVTGHSTVDVVLKHYFQPDRNNFRHVLESKMPTFMTAQRDDGKNLPHVICRLKELAAELTENNFQQKKDQIQELLLCLTTTM
jgi:integrase